MVPLGDTMGVRGERQERYLMIIASHFSGINIPGSDLSHTWVDRFFADQPFG